MNRLILQNQQVTNNLADPAETAERLLLTFPRPNCRLSQLREVLKYRTSTSRMNLKASANVCTSARCIQRTLVESMFSQTLR